MTLKQRKTKHMVDVLFVGMLAFAVVFVGLTGTSMASDDITTALNNLTKIICSIVTVVGVILTIWGFVQFFLSLSSHDTSQKSQGLWCIVSGIGVAVAPWIVVSVLAGTSVNTGGIPTS